MPGNVSLAEATLVIPHSLYTSFQAQREYAVQVNEYPSGDSQREIQVTNSRRKWTVAERLVPEKMTELRQFYDTVGADPFFFYDPYDRDFPFFYDPTGASLNARYTVRFDSEWKQNQPVGRGHAGPIVLVEMAQHIAGAQQANFTQTQSSAQAVTVGF